MINLWDHWADSSLWMGRGILTTIIIILIAFILWLIRENRNQGKETY